MIPAMASRLGRGVEIAELAELRDRRIVVNLRSSAIASAEYDGITQTLTINFRNGGSYDYPDTPISTFHNLCRAPSPGRFYIDNIKLS